MLQEVIVSGDEDWVGLMVSGEPEGPRKAQLGKGRR